MTHTLPKSALISLFAVFYFSTAFSQTPSANFTANITSGCSPLVVNFIDQSTGNPNSWSWDFGNGNTSTLQNPSAIFLNAGGYTVKLTVTNANGSNTLVRNFFINVYESPTVNFSGAPLSGCYPLHVQFSDLSSAGAGNSIASWYWDFGNGINSSLQNPATTYAAAGNYSVLLRVTNDKGCTKAISKTNYIAVSPGVQADFTNTQAVVCRPPSNINFTNSSTGPGALSYSWNFGDGTTSSSQNPSHIYSSGGTFSVTLVTTSSSGCFDTIRHDVLITNNTTAINSPDSICVNYPMSFQNASTPSPASASWNFGDATSSTQINPVKIYSTPGTYLVKLVNTYANCQDSASKSIKILARPVANFTAPIVSKCKQPLTVTFQDLSAGAANWQWNFGDGATSNLQNPSHTYNSFGNFDVTLIITSASGCNDTIVKPQFIKIQSAQIAIPSLPQKGCIPYTISPIANIIAIDTVTSYMWDFGDGTTSTLVNPTHVYPLQGTYTVKLYISTSSGCNDSLIIPAAVKVGSKPSANFSAAPIPQCSFQPVQFTDLSTPFVDEWSWDFGDGGSSSVQNPAYSYGNPGTYTVRLIASNNGCADTMIRVSYTTALPPVAQFNYTANCSNRLEFNFNDQSVGPLTWSWDFGDGTTSNSQNPVHDFPALGAYTVTLTVTNGSCSHSITQVVRAIDENPDLVASTHVGCKNLNVTLSGIVTTANVAGYAWSFDGGVTFLYTSFPTMSNIYTTSGTYTNILITTDLNGCRDTIVKPNNIRVNGPVAGFSATNTAGCKGLTTLFNDLSTNDSIHSIVNWQWDFGDGTIQNLSGPPFPHVYSIAGTYSVKLITTDNVGCKDSTVAVDLVTASDPHANFVSPDTLSCPNANVNFTNQSTAVNYTSNWDFGDGNNSATNSPSHAYAATGIYPVKLVITDQYGCSDSLTKNSYVKVATPLADFSVSDSASSCTPFEVLFTNTSQYYSGWSWDLAGIFCTQTNPSYFFSSLGTYPITLIVTSPGGCQDTITKNIYVYDTIGSNFSYAPLGGCKPISIDFAAFSPGPVKYLWDFGDGTMFTTTTPLTSHLYNAFGNFLPKLIMQSNANCLVALNGPDTLHIVGTTANFGVNKNLFCDTARVSFIDSTIYNDPIVSYNWSFGDGLTSTQQNPFHQYDAPGFYNVSLAVRTLQGCVDTMQKNNLIKIVERPHIFIAGDSIECIYEPMRHTGGFVIPDTSLVTWNWNFPNGKNSSSQNPAQQTYTASGSFFVTLIATNSTGCRDTATKKIVVNPLPVVNMPGTMTMQAGFPVTIPATYSPNTATYLWTPATTLSCNNCAQPTANPKFNTTYNVVFVDSNGCRNTASITVVVICKNANVFMPNTFSPNGDGSNDVFYPRGKGINRVKSMRIFNRWGEVVFESKDFPINDPTYGWDGKFKGRAAQSGIFVYQVEFYCDNGEIITLNGDVNLLL